MLAIRTAFLKALLDEMRARGHDPASLAACSGVAIEDMTVEASARVAAIADEIAQLVDDGNLGIVAAMKAPWRLSAFGAPLAVGSVAVPPVEPAPTSDLVSEVAVAPTSPSLADALARVAALSGWADPRARFTFELAETGGVLAFHVAGAPEGLGRHGNEHVLVAALGLARALTGRDLSPRRAWLANAEPADSSAIRAALGCADIIFGAGDSGLVLDSDALAAMIVAPLPELPANAPLDLVAALRERLKPTLRVGVTPVGAMARALALSTRTLQRRLGELGTSYGDVLDDLRRDLARIRLEQRDLSVAAAARQLGYSDSRAFIRAFRRWTGATPGAYQLRA
jgi:AraC-like DNA-binding protein